MGKTFWNSIYVLSLSLSFANSPAYAGLCSDTFDNQSESPSSKSLAIRVESNMGIAAKFPAYQGLFPAKPEIFEAAPQMKLSELAQRQADIRHDGEVGAKEIFRSYKDPELKMSQHVLFREQLLEIMQAAVMT